jgi:hypothetical protein
MRELLAPMTVIKKPPAAALRSCEEIAPVATLVAVGVVDDITLAQAQRAMPSIKELFTSNSRGVLVHDVLGVTTVTLAMKVQRRAFTLFYDRADRSFMCTVWRPGQAADECFAVGRPAANYRRIGSILGETTLDGILRVLDIPRHALLPDEEPADADAWPTWGN